MTAAWTSMGQAWEWFVIAGLGIFHGLNPAMGWLFAVALGLHRHSRRAVLLAIPPMALGHALSILVVTISVLSIGMLFDVHAVRIACGCALIAWALYHVRYGHRHRVRVGMLTGSAGLVLWSFLMATAHGAGLMLIPALIPLCGSMAFLSPGSVLISLAAVGLHTAATLIVSGAVAVLVYDRLWVCALLATGGLLIMGG
jgi:hypothetical protein